jgi:hypothetical protein
MMKHIPPVALAACIAPLSFIWLSAAEAKQQCRVAMPSNSHEYWSWRLIDGRKCWYEGKPGLSKSLLEWPAPIASRPAASKELASAVTAKPSGPLDSQAWAPAEPDTFDALWRARVEQH